MTTFAGFILRTDDTTLLTIRHRTGGEPAGISIPILRTDTPSDESTLPALLAEELGIEATLNRPFISCIEPPDPSIANCRLNPFWPAIPARIGIYYLGHATSWDLSERTGNQYAPLHGESYEPLELPLHRLRAFDIAPQDVLDPLCDLLEVYTPTDLWAGRSAIDDENG